MGFNNQPKKDGEEEGDSPISTWYIDPEAWEEVRSEQAAQNLPPSPSVFRASLNDGYVVSLNYACEVVARQRGV